MSYNLTMSLKLTASQWFEQDCLASRSKCQQRLEFDWKMTLLAPNGLGVQYCLSEYAEDCVHLGTLAVAVVDAVGAALVCLA